MTPLDLLVAVGGALLGLVLVVALLALVLDRAERGDHTPRPPPEPWR